MSAETPSGALQRSLCCGVSGGGQTTVLRPFGDPSPNTLSNGRRAVAAVLARRREGTLAIGIDARTRGFGPTPVSDTIAGHQRNPPVPRTSVFAGAHEGRRADRHAVNRCRPLAPNREPAGSAFGQSVSSPLSAADRATPEPKLIWSWR